MKKLPAMQIKAARKVQPVVCLVEFIAEKEQQTQNFRLRSDRGDSSKHQLFYPFVVRI